MGVNNDRGDFKQKAQSHEKILIGRGIMGYLAVLVLILFVVPTAFAAQLPVDLGGASDFAILTKTGITNVPTSSILGNVGSSPITGAAIGLTCVEVTGNIYTVDAAGPLPCRIQDDTLLSTAVSNMEAAYTNAAGRTTDSSPEDTTELNAGNISGLTISPGLHKWSTDVIMDGTGVTLSGSSTDVWIFQIEGDLTLASGARVILEGGAVSKNIFWQVAGPIGVTLNTTSHMEGTLLSAKQIIIKTGATLNGRALAQTQVTLESNTIVLDDTAPTINSVVTIDDDVVYGYDQNINIRINGFDNGSGIASLDVNYYDINGSSMWVRATQVDENNYYINTGSDWNHNFVLTNLEIRVNDVVGNSVQTTIDNSIVLNNMVAPTGFDGDTTNFNDINDFSAVSNLTFEKVGLGKIIFMSPVDLSDPSVIAQLQGIASAMTFRDSSTGNRIIGFDTSSFNGALNGIDVNVSVYNLTFATIPGLLHEGIRCDNNVSICNTSYVGGTFNFVSTLGFSEYEIDGNAPILTDATVVNNTTATLRVTINELATCKYTIDLDKNYDTIVDMNATSADMNASWLLTDLNSITTYTKNVWCRDLAGNDSNLLITFDSNVIPLAVVNLGTAGNYGVLAKTAVTAPGSGLSLIVGNIGLSPAAASYITGLGLIMDSSGVFATSTLVDGNVYASDYTTPTPTNLTTAIGDMEIAYTDAAGRTNPDYTELGAGNIGGMTLTPGLYKWSSGLTIPTDVTLFGDANDVWIFQIAQTLDLSNNKKIILSGGALPKNIFWQVAGQATLGTNSTFSGTILGQTAIVLNTDTVLNGRALAQTAVTIGDSTVNSTGIETIDDVAPIFDLNNLSIIISDTNVVIDVNSSEKVIVKYSIDEDKNYASMINGQLIDINGVIIIYDLIGGTDYNIYVRARDIAGNDSNESKIISFTTLADETNPIISLSSLTKTTSSAQLTITTNESVTCRRSTSNLSYDLMPTDVNLLITTTKGIGTGTINLSGLSANTAYTFYVVCRDSNNNDVQASLAFTTDAIPSSGGGSSSGGGTYSPTCTSFEYSDWSVCDDGEQTRTITSKTPTNCVNGSPILTKTCYIEPFVQVDSTGLSNPYVFGTDNYYKRERYNQESLGLPITNPITPTTPTTPATPGNPSTPTTGTVSEAVAISPIAALFAALDETAGTVSPILLLIILGLLAIAGYNAIKNKQELEEQEKNKVKRDNAEKENKKK